MLEGFKKIQLKRHWSKDNPYFLKINNKYVSLKNFNNRLRKIEIEDSLFNAFNKLFRTSK